MEPDWMTVSLGRIGIPDLNRVVSMAAVKRVDKSGMTIEPTLMNKEVDLEFISNVKRFH